jgi:hypothetical protein
MVLLYKSIQLIWRGAVFALCIQFRIAQCPLAVPAMFPFHAAALIWLQIYDIINAIRKICCCIPLCNLSLEKYGT